jgi:hypothetical protein
MIAYMKRVEFGAPAAQFAGVVPVAVDESVGIPGCSASATEPVRKTPTRPVAWEPTASRIETIVESL